jgi:diadenosine tetraphosphate (Ap4A) HIT family hydrolase
MFELHPQLKKETLTVGNFPLCLLLLMNDINYPWFILVPRRARIREIFELSQVDQQQLLKESSQLSRVLSTFFLADKMNIAALGNMVPQLHIHHIVRYRNDRAWPNPVWGLFPAHPYSVRALRETCSGLIDHLTDFIPDNRNSLAPRVG